MDVSFVPTSKISGEMLVDLMKQYNPIKTVILRKKVLVSFKTPNQAQMAYDMLNGFIHHGEKILLKLESSETIPVTRKLSTKKPTNIVSKAKISKDSQIINPSPEKKFEKDEKQKKMNVYQESLNKYHIEESFKSSDVNRALEKAYNSFKEMSCGLISKSQKESLKIKIGAVKNFLDELEPEDDTLMLEMDADINDPQILVTILRKILPRLKIFLGRILSSNLLNHQIASLCSHISNFLEMINEILNTELDQNTKFIVISYSVNVSSCFTDDQFDFRSCNAIMILGGGNKLDEVQLTSEQNQEYEEALKFYDETIKSSKLLQTAIENFILVDNADFLKKKEHYQKIFSNHHKFIWISTELIQGMVGFNHRLILNVNHFFSKDKLYNKMKFIQTMLHELSHLAYRSYKNDFLSLSGASLLERPAETIIENYLLEGGYRFENLVFGYPNSDPKTPDELKIFFDPMKWNSTVPLYKDAQNITLRHVPNPYLSGLGINSSFISKRKSVSLSNSNECSYITTSYNPIVFSIAFLK